jgi:hypothetical protein
MPPDRLVGAHSVVFTLQRLKGLLVSPDGFEVHGVISIDKKVVYELRRRFSFEEWRTPSC